MPGAPSSVLAPSMTNMTATKLGLLQAAGADANLDILLLQPASIRTHDLLGSHLFLQGTHHITILFSLNSSYIQS